MKLKGATYVELLDYMTGRALMEIGKGESFRNVVSLIWQLSLQWKAENEPEKKCKLK